ncbi:MAG: ATP-binding protein [Myxococcales bacterium]|nr:ATP-binding protein [Myxococcales bacterium]
MLLQFAVSNYRSFGEAQVFSLLSSTQKSRRASLDERVRRPVQGGLQALTSSVIFGANASGKSNLFRALRFCTGFILDSARDGQADDPIDVQPFRLRPDLVDQPSMFEIIFEDEGVRYRYGFEADAERVHSEWLFQTRKRETLVFERDGDRFDGQQQMNLGELGRHTRPNALFLSVAAQLNHPLAQQLLRWFRRIGFVGGIHEVNTPFTARQLADETALAGGIRSLLTDLDLGIQDIRASRLKLDRSALPSDLPADLADFVSKNSFRISTLHAICDADGRTVGETWFDLDDESDGTRKVFALAGPIIETLRHGRVILIDEYDARLHPLLGRGLLDLFNDPRTNPHGAQLVAVTHGTQLMDLGRMRRDQFWFVDKDRRGQSELYALSEIKGVRNDTAVQKAYLQGRYGATPRVRYHHPDDLLGTGT